MGNVVLSSQIMLVSEIICALCLIICLPLIPITIKSGINKESGYCFGGIMLTLTLVMFAVVFAYFLGIVETVLKIAIAIIIGNYSDMTGKLAIKTVKQDMQIACAYLMISILSYLGMLALFWNAITS